MLNEWEIIRPIVFWEEKRKKLCLFYMNAMFPEILNPRKTRKRYLRNISFNDFI
jgi:hypothetical protein